MINQSAIQRIITAIKRTATGSELLLVDSAHTIPAAYKKISRENGLLRSISNNGICLTIQLKLIFFYGISNSKPNLEIEPDYNFFNELNS
jgi:hypothetical protein